MNRFGRCWSGAWEVLSRTKSIDVNQMQQTQLRRCLTVVDLIALGVGSTLGAGIYVLTGQVAKTQTGPAIIISFIPPSSCASFLRPTIHPLQPVGGWLYNGAASEGANRTMVNTQQSLNALQQRMCYAEFAARVPKAGSAYVYSYVSLGELWAFVIGWNMILENMIGAASSGKAWSQYFDSVLNDTIRRYIETNVGNMTVPGFDTYPDFLAMGLLIVATLLVSIGVNISTTINLVFTVINLAVIVCIFGVGLFYADVNNWTHSPGGFFPFQFKGVVAGAATCFYALVGFDTIAASGEESTKPTKHVPIAIVSTLAICLVAYLGVGSILTLLVPWNKLADTAALPKAFAQVGVPGAEYVIAVGGLCGLTASIMGSMFPLSRGVYAMAQDGLVFRCLGRVSRHTDTPLIATSVFGVLIAAAALLFDLDALIQMMSIGTLMAYTLVAVSVLVLHYQREQVGLAACDEPPGTVTNGGPTLVGRSTSTSGHIANDTASMTSQASLSGTLLPGGVGGMMGSRMSISEDTGLLRVGDGSNRVRYVPAKTTTVFKRIKPPTDSDEEQTPSSGPADVTPVSSRPSSCSDVPPESEVVEAYRARVAAEQHERHLVLAAAAAAAASANNVDGVATTGNSYRRVDSDYSVDNLSQLFNVGDETAKTPSSRSRRIAIACLVAIVIIWTSICATIVYGESYLASATWWPLLIIISGLVVMLGLVAVLYRQPRNDTPLHFRTPAVPWLPLASVLINVYLMMTLSVATWIRFAVWMTVGFVIYLGYGIWHSSERRSDDGEVILYNVGDKDSLIVDGVYR